MPAFRNVILSGLLLGACRSTTTPPAPGVASAVDASVGGATVDEGRVLMSAWFADRAGGSERRQLVPLVCWNATRRRFGAGDECISLVPPGATVGLTGGRTTRAGARSTHVCRRGGARRAALDVQ